MNARRRVAITALLLLLLLLGGGMLTAVLRPTGSSRPGEHAADVPGAAPSDSAGSGRSRRRPTTAEVAPEIESPSRPAATNASETTTDGVGVDPALADPPTTGPVRIRRDEPSGVDDKGALRVRVDDGAGSTRTDVRLYVSAEQDGKLETHRLELAGPEGVTLAPLDEGWARIELRSGSATRKTRVRIDPGLLTDVELTLRAGATVTGTVRHRRHGVLAGVHMRCRESAAGENREGELRDTLFAIADKEGTFRLTGVPDGTYVLAYEGGALGYGLNPRSTLLVQGGQDVRHDVLLGDVSIVGIVSDAATRRPIAGAQVVLTSPHFSMTSTDAEGRFRFFDLPAGDYRIAVAHDGFGVLLADTGAVTPGRALRREFHLVAAAPLVLEIRDEVGEPVTTMITLTFTPADGTEGTRGSMPVLPDGHGRVVFDRAVAGRYSLGVGAPGHEDATVELTLAGEETRVEVVLARDMETVTTTLLAGLIVDDETGAPIAGARVSLRSSPLCTTSGPDGTFRLHGRGTRPSGVFVGVDGYGIALFPVADTDPVEIRLRPAAELVLHFRSKDGTPLEGRVSIGVSARSKGGTNIGTSVQADARGVATFSRIIPGRYTLRFSSAIGGKAQLEAEVQPGRNQLDVDLH